MEKNATEITVLVSRWSSKNPEDQFVVENPATPKAITIVQGGGAAEVDAAVRAAHRVYHDHWRWVPAQQRGRLLKECAGVYARDHDLALRTARQIDVGIVNVNNYFRGGIGGPFGGTKASGYGREHSIETLHEFGRSKAVREPSGIGQILQWRIL